MKKTIEETEIECGQQLINMSKRHKKEIEDIRNQLLSESVFHKEDALLLTEAQKEIENYEISILKVMKQRDIAVEALELIEGPVEFYCEIGEQSKQTCAREALKQIGELK